MNNTSKKTWRAGFAFLLFSILLVTFIFHEPKDFVTLAAPVEGNPNEFSLDGIHQLNLLDDEPRNISQGPINIRPQKTKKKAFRTEELDYRVAIPEEDKKEEPKPELAEEENKAEEDKQEEVSYPNSEMIYTLAQFKFRGIIFWGDYKYSFYSQSVLPGNNLSIPGRHVDENGYVADGDGFIVLASSAPRGTIFPTPFGKFGKVYDKGTVGNHLDVYIR